MPQQLIIHYGEYAKLVEKLTAQLVGHQYEPNLIVGIIRGGFYPADIISRVLGVEWAFLYVQSYGHDHTPGQIRLGRELIGSKPERNDSVLIVDDLADSGQTLEKTMEWFDVHYPDYGLKFKTAVLWKKEGSTFDPDFCAAEINYIEGTAECPWIVQAHEYEAERIQKALRLNG